MSLQQSKAEKNDAAPVRRAGGGGKSGASAAAHPPKGGVGGPSPHNASNTSGKRHNGPGGQSRGNPNAGVSHSNAYAKVQNGGITQRQQTGSTSATSGSLPISTVKQPSVAGPRSNGILTKPPIAQSSNLKASEQTSSSSTAAVLGDGTRAMAQQPLFQFGSFSPTGISGFQVPARTSSAPPNFDEQKRDQARSGPPLDVSVSKTSTLSGTTQQLEGPTVSKQVASIIESTIEGNKILQGPKASPPFVQSQDVPGGQIPSALPLRSKCPPTSQFQSHGATSGSRVASSHLQSHGMAPVPRASSSHVQSQCAPSVPHAPSSQMQSQGVATELHALSYKYQSQGAISVPRGQSSQLQPQGAVSVPRGQSPQLQPQGGPLGLHGLSSQLQSQVLTTGLYAPSSQLQSQGVAPGSRSLQVQLQIPQVQHQVFSSQGLTAGALHSQGMLQHGLGYPQTMRHIIPPQTHVPSQQFIHTNHQINAQIPVQVTGSGGTPLPSYLPATQANQSVPQRTSTVKITHPETHEEIKFGPKVVKSDSHADGGIGTLVSDGSVPGGPPQYGTTHSGSVSISSLSQMTFYPTVSSGSYAQPPVFHQPPKITTGVKPNIVRPSSMSNVPPVHPHGANVDTSKQPPQTTESSLVPVKASEGKVLTPTISISESRHSLNSSAIAASGREDAGNPAVSKSNVGDKCAILSTPTTATHNHPDGNVSASSAVSSGEEQKSESGKSDVGAKRSCTNMPATGTHNPPDGDVSTTSAVSAIEEQKSDSVKPVGVFTKEHSKKPSKLESKSKKHQQQASVSRTCTNAQVELKVESVVESSEVSASADASKSGFCHAKQKKQQQPPLVRSSSNAQLELKEMVPESLEVSSTVSVVPLVTAPSMVPSVTAPSKPVKSVDRGASPELARKAIETIIHSSSTEPGEVVIPSNLTSIPIKTDKTLMSNGLSGHVSNTTEFSSSVVPGHSGAVDKMLNNESSSGSSESVQDSDAKDEIIPGNMTSHLDILDQTGKERIEMSGLMNESVAKEVGQPMKVGDVTVCIDTVITSSNSAYRDPVFQLDSNTRDVKSLESSVALSKVGPSSSVQSVNRDNEDTGILPQETLPGKLETNVKSGSLLSEHSSSVNINGNPDDCADYVIVDEKASLLKEEANYDKIRHDSLISQQAEHGNGMLIDHQNLIKDKKTTGTMQSTNSDDKPQMEPRSETPGFLPVAPVADMQQQPGLLVDKIVDSKQSCMNACKGINDVITGAAEPSTVNVKTVDVQDRAQVPISNNSNHEDMTASLRVSSQPLESDTKLDSLARVAEKETKSSLNALSNNKITNTADVPKTIANKKKKKLKDCLSKADAAAPTGDLYNAYKVPEKQEDVNSAEPCKTDSTDVEEKPSLKETQKHIPNEVDDWEDAAELSTNMKQVVLPMSDVNCSGDRKYSRDFLLTFREHFNDLPLQFEICQDFGDILINRLLISSHYSEGEPFPSMGRVPEYSRLDRRGNNVPSMDEDRWIKPMDAGTRDMRVDIGLGGPGGFRSGQGYNTGFGKNMRGAAPGGGPGGQFVQASFAQSGLMRNNTAEVDRWRTSGMQKGLIPPPMIHKTDNRYEVGKVSDEEESKQRKIKSILNKLTPQNFETLFLRVQEVNIDSAVCLTGVISQIFDKALMEPTFCEMYAKFCVQLAAGLPEFYEDSERVMFRRVLLNKCQEEFERDEREQAEAEMPEDGEIKLSKEEREGKRSAQRRRMLGNIRFIGELYKESMLTERIMHECIKKLLGEYQKPDEENVESLCKLMSTIGHMIDHPKAREHIDAYFDRIAKMANNQALPTRLRFMLKDVIDLRRNGWQQRRKVDGPKKIEEVHRDAAQERQQALGGRLNRAPSMGHSGRRISTPPDHGSRGPQMSPFMPGTPMGPAAHMSGMRGTQAQTGMRNYMAQDARITDRMTGERAMPLPLQHRPSDDGQLTLGPQGGLGRGITGRGQPMQTNRSSLADGPLVASGSSRRGSLAPMPAYNSNAGGDRMSFGTRDDNSFRTSVGEKSSLPRSGISERNALGNDRRDYRGSYSSFDRGGRATNLEYQQEYSHGREFSEEQLKNKSDMAIKEYYSVRDMKEATLCVSELKSPWYHPTLVSLWILDSFDRKDLERDGLGDLFIHLCKTEPSLLSQEQLMKGLEKVIASLEDSVVDAPKAPEFLGKILGKLVGANLLSIHDIAVPLEEGVEPGSRVEYGHAVDVLATILSFLKREKGENVLLDLYRSSGLQLEKLFHCSDKRGTFESYLEKNNIQCLSTAGHP